MTSYAVTSLISFVLGCYAGLSYPKIVSWLKSEETKASAVAQGELSKITAKL